MKTQTKDRIKGYCALTLCLIVVGFAATGHTKPTTWHVIILPLLPPIIYPTW